VTATASELDLTTAGVELLAKAVPNVSPYGVKMTVSFRGRVGSVIRFYAGADADVSVSAEVTLGADCGQLRFYEQSLSGETLLPDVFWIRELRGEEWHRMVLCYDPTRGYLTATVTTLAGETQDYTALIGSTGAAGYGVGTVTDTAEFKSLSASETGHVVISGGGSYGTSYDCPTCNPSCSLAGSAFSGTLSACDWTGRDIHFRRPGRRELVRWHTGTEIDTVPYVLTATFQDFTYDHYVDIYADAVTVNLTWIRVWDGAKVDVQRGGTLRRRPDSHNVHRGHSGHACRGWAVYREGL